MTNKQHSPAACGPRYVPKLQRVHWLSPQQSTHSLKSFLSYMCSGHRISGARCCTNPTAMRGRTCRNDLAHFPGSATQLSTDATAWSTGVSGCEPSLKNVPV